MLCSTLLATLTSSFSSFRSSNLCSGGSSAITAAPEAQAFTHAVEHFWSAGFVGWGGVTTDFVAWSDCACARCLCSLRFWFFFTALLIGSALPSALSFHT